jgi:hypothetical protein
MGTNVNTDFEKATVPQLIADKCDTLKAMLLEKNKDYGNSALDPVRIFSRADPIEQIRVRIDDKLSRLMRGGEFPGEDTIKDLLGYLILLQVSESMKGPVLEGEAGKLKPREPALLRRSFRVGETGGPRLPMAQIGDSDPPLFRDVASSLWVIGTRDGQILKDPGSSEWERDPSNTTIYWIPMTGA